MKKSEWIVLLAVVAAAAALFALKHRDDQVNGDTRNPAPESGLVIVGQSQNKPAVQQKSAKNPAVREGSEHTLAGSRQANTASKVPDHRSRTFAPPADSVAPGPSEPSTPEQKSAAVFSYISKLKRNDANTNMLKDYVARHADMPQWSGPVQDYINGVLQEKSAERFARGLYHVECGGGLCIVAGYEDPNSRLTGALNARMARDGRSLGVAGWRLWRTEEDGWLGMYASPEFKLPNEPGR